MSQLGINRISKPVGFRTPVSLWYRFKARCYEEGYEVSRVLTTMIRLFVENDEFRKKILEELD